MGLEAVIQLSKAIVVPAIKHWLADRRRAGERMLPLAELINRQVIDDLQRRKVDREIERLVDSVASYVAPLVATRFAAVPENEVRAALDAVGDAFRATDLSDHGLFAADADPVKLARRLRERVPDGPARAGLSKPATRLYEAALDAGCVSFTQLVVQLTPFAHRGIAELLNRSSTIADKLDEILARLPAHPLPDSSDVDGGFLARYLGYLSESLDHLELYGVDVRRYRPRTTLSVAYVSLSVTATGGTRTRDRLARWSPGSLRLGLADDPTEPRSAGAVRVEQALASSDRTLVRGGAGSGKSTLLRWLAINAARGRLGGDLAEWNGRVPFLIKLRRHAGDRPPPPERFLHDVAEPLAGAAPEWWVHRQLESGRVLLLVDGVDEIPAGQRAGVRRWLHELVAAYPYTKVVVTSRPAAAAERWLAAEGFATANLERMTPSGVQALIRQWHDAVRDAGDLPCPEAELPAYERKLVGWLEANPPVHAIATNPLMCAMLCALNLDRATHLPGDRMGIYHAAFEMLLERRDAERDIASDVPELTTEDKRQVLQYLAWQMSFNGRTEASRSDALHWIGERLDAMPRVGAGAEAVLGHLVHRSGVLQEPVPDRFDFVHRTFQEYLAAREAANRRNDGFLCEKAHLDSWRETIIMALGHGNAPFGAELLGQILDRADREPGRRRRLILLAAACQETMSTVDPPLRHRIEAGLGELLPPRSTVEARSLAAVGEPLLRRMPTDLGELSDAKAAAAVRTVAMVNGSRALDLLARYAADSRGAVQRALAEVWEFFDPEEYVDRVLGDAPLDEGRLTVKNPALLDVAQRLNHLTDLTVEPTPGPFDVRRLEGVPSMTRFGASGVQLMNANDLDWVTAHDKLRELALTFPDAEWDLAPLTTLSELTDLRLFGISAALELDQLRRLAALRSLCIDGERHNRPLDFLAELPRLDWLIVGNWAQPRLSVLRRMPALRALWLWCSGAPRGGLGQLVDTLPDLVGLDLSDCRWVSDLTPLVRLRALERLDLYGTPDSGYTPLAGLPTLRILHLGSCDRLGDLDEVACLPQLRHLYLWSIGEEVELSPFANCRLTVHLLDRVRVVGVERLGPGVRIIRR